MSEDSEKVAGMAIMSMARDIDELKTEIELLRLQVKMIPLPEYRDDPRLYEVIEEQRTEIERLRGLLIEWQSNDSNGVLTFRQRVREALGEK